jgi:DUF971 family protein
MLQPVALSLIDDVSLQITWSDGAVLRTRIAVLREACPCATCREKQRAAADKPKGRLPVLAPAEARPLKITRMTPVGNYAYNIDFSDGHGSGLFTMEMLRQLGQPAPPA